VFLNAEGMKPAEIYRRMLTQYGDLAPCDYHLFWPVKDAIRESHFSSAEEVMSCMNGLNSSHKTSSKESKH
jgi:hypothetical protein